MGVGRFSEPGDPDAGAVVAAIKFDRAAPDLIRTAVALAERAGRPLRLVHVYSTDYPVYSSAYGLDAALYGFSSDVRRETYVPITGDSHDYDESGAPPRPYTSPVDLARIMLREYARIYAADQGPGSGPHAETLTDVVVGSFPETLVEYADDIRATLVVVGAAVRDPGFLRGRLKSTFRLMATAGAPVLVIKDSVADALAATFDDVLGHTGHALRPLRLLIADDLTDASLPGLTAAERLLATLEVTADVLHLHVEAQPTVGFALSPDYELEFWPGLVIRERPVTEQHERLLARLRGRAHDLAQKVIAAGGRYQTQLWHGRVDDEICRAVAVHQADLTIFGQHRFFHRDPLTLGQMPFGSMLNVQSAVLVAPPGSS